MYDAPMSNERVEILVKELRGLDLFRGLEEGEIRSLLKGSRVKRFARGTWVFHEGDPGDDLILILRGEMEILKIDQSGAEYLITTLPAGEFMGERSLLEQKPRSAAARAGADSLLLHMDRADYLRVMEENPRALAKLMLRMVTVVSDRLRLLNEHYVLTKGCLDRLKNF